MSNVINFPSPLRARIMARANQERAALETMHHGVFRAEGETAEICASFKPAIIHNANANERKP